MALRREASPQKQRSSGATATPGPYNQMIRRLTGRLRQVQDELALESVTNIEFEEASRKSFELLTSQVKSLKDAFNTLTDTLLEEIDGVGAKVDEKLKKFTAELQDPLGAIHAQAEAHKAANNHSFQNVHNDILERLERLEAERPAVELSMQQLNQDVETVLRIIPKLEDKIDHALEDMVKVTETLSQQHQESGDQHESKLRTLETELREDFDQRHLKLQRSITRQFESMSKVLAESSPQTRRVDFTVPASPPSSRLSASLGRPGGDREDSGRAASLRNLRLN